MKMTKFSLLSRVVGAFVLLVTLWGCTTTATLENSAPPKKFEGKLGAVSVNWRTPIHLPYKVSTVSVSYGVVPNRPKITTEQKEYAQRRVADLANQLRTGMESTLMNALGPSVRKGDDAVIIIVPTELWVTNGGVTLKLRVTLTTKDRRESWTILPVIDDASVYKADKSIEQLNQLILNTAGTLIADELRKAGWI